MSSDDEADRALTLGQEESMLGKNGSDHDFFQGRFDALTANERSLLRENIKLGNTKSDAARKKVIVAKLEEIQVDCRLLQNYLQRGAAASAAACATTAVAAAKKAADKAAKTAEHKAKTTAALFC